MQNTTPPKSNSIRHYRRRANLKLYEVSQVLGLSSPAHLAHWEKGRKLPHLDYVLMLAALFRVPIDVLYVERLNHWRRVMRDRRAMLTTGPQ